MPNTWDELAYAFQQSRHVSADKLIEWPAQLRMLGDFRGKRILDLGCGSGDKTRHFAEHGAASVIGIDSSKGFSREWSSAHADVPNLQLIEGSLDDLHHLPELDGKRFDLIVSFQAIMYARDLPGTLRTVAQLLTQCKRE